MKTKSKTVRISREKLEELRRIGQSMSNFCFNMAQPSWPWDERFRKSLDQMRQSWDAASMAVFEELQKGSVTDA